MPDLIGPDGTNHGEITELVHYRKLWCPPGTDAYIVFVKSPEKDDDSVPGT